VLDAREYALVVLSASPGDSQRKEEDMTELESNWRSLYKTSAAAALLMLGYSLATMVLLVAVGGQPTSAREGFDMLAQSRLMGLLRLDLLTVLVLPLYYLLLLGLFAALRKAHTVPVAVAALLGCAGVTLVLATPSALSWLALSDKLAQATSEALKSQLLAAGEAILVSDMWHGTGAVMGGLLLQTGMLLASLLMLRGNVFGRATAWVGTVTHGLDLLHIVVIWLFPVGGVVLMVVAGPLYLVWFPLLSRDFFRLARGASTDS
jgi:hypothetical protein